MSLLKSSATSSKNGSKIGLGSYEIYVPTNSNAVSAAAEYFSLSTEAKSTAQITSKKDKLIPAPVISNDEYIKYYDKKQCCFVYQPISKIDDMIKQIQSA